MKKFTYSFNEGSKQMKQLLGGKGANLAEMCKIGLPVPFGFTVTTEACKDFLHGGQEFENILWQQVEEKIRELEIVTGKKFGEPENPLLVSVRSDGQHECPRLMETILNLGLNDETVKGLAKQGKDLRFALKSYCNFLISYGCQVLEVPKTNFEQIINSVKPGQGVASLSNFQAEQLQQIASAFQRMILETSGKEIPQNPMDQLKGAICAAFRSWNHPESVLYRKLQGIEGMGTAVNVQKMVFGNLSKQSGVGVANTRDPQTGDHQIYVRFLVEGQGRDLDLKAEEAIGLEEMKCRIPKSYEGIVKIAGILEHHYRDMQQVEFTIENGKLYVLQTGCGKRSIQAATKIAVDLKEEKLIDSHTAMNRIRAEQLEPYLSEQGGRISPELEKLLSWADESKDMKVRALIKNAAEAEVAISLGAEGLLILSEFWENDHWRNCEEELKEIFIRAGEEPIALCLSADWDLKKLIDISKMCIQLEMEVNKEVHQEMSLELVLTSLVSIWHFQVLKERLGGELLSLFPSEVKKSAWSFGAMLQTPSMALDGASLAKTVDSICFDSCQLTINSYGLRKEGTAKVEQLKWLRNNPFFNIAQDSVGKQMAIAVKEIRQERSKFKMGSIFEKGLNGKTVNFCQQIGLSYVACPVLQVPGAKIEAAQALTSKDRKE